MHAPVAGDRPSDVPLWPSLPVPPGDAAARCATPGPDGFDASLAFASGRQAITAALRDIGLGRHDRVAVPEWSSHCVVSAVGQVATPVPMAEALECGNARAVLVYEQWGWAYPAAELDAVRQRFSDAVLILDRVDSPRFDAPASTWRGYEIWSFSKTLGFRNGGAARRNRSDWLRPAANPDADDPDDGVPSSAADIDLIRFRATRPDPACRAMIETGETAARFAAEAAARQERTDLLLRASGSQWLRTRFEEGGSLVAPGLFPLGWGWPAEKLDALQARAASVGLETARYHFNGAPSAIAPDYRPCVAVPVHGQAPLDRLEDFAKSLLTKPRPQPKRIAVVGAGLAGLAAAAWYAGRGERPVVIEKAPAVGGLLQSVAVDGFAFDAGTHFAIATGDAEMDAILFDDLPDVSFRTFRDSLKEGHYWNGGLNRDTGCIDARTLPAGTLAKAQHEVLDRAGIDGTGTVDGGARTADARTADARTFLDATVGETLTRDVYAPVLEKLTGRQPETLLPSVVQTLSLARVVLFDSAVSRNLKRQKTLDGRLAYTRRSDGSSGRPKLYPREGGIGAWIGALRDKAERAGGEFLTEVGVSALEIARGSVTAITLDDSRTLACDLVVWTGSAELLLRAAGRPVSGRVPAFRDLALYHVVSDAPLLTDLHWVTNYDPAFQTYRVTQYPNIVAGARSRPHLTVEILLSPDDVAPPFGLIAEELAHMGLIASAGSVTCLLEQRHARAMPVPTPEEAAEAGERRQAAEALADNIILAGRASGRFHQIAMLADLHDRMQAGPAAGA